MSAMIVKLRKLGGIGKKAGVDLELPDGLEDVTALRKLVADKLGLEGKRLRLSHKGRVLHDFGSLPKIAEGDVLSYALAPRPPDEYLRETVDGGFEEDEERELRFDIESLPSHWQRKLASHLRHRAGLPDAALLVIFALSPTRYAVLVAWFLFGRLASSQGLGSLYLVLSVIAFIFTNLGKRREGEASAYTVFNNFQALPGQLTGDQLERQMVRGQLT